MRRIGEKKGSKRHLLVDGHGVPLSLVVTGANRHDVTQLEPVLDAIVLPLPPEEEGPFLYADKAYDGEPAQQAIRSRGYIPRISRKKRGRGRPPKNRRWVVEAAHSWFNRFRKLLVRYEKLAESYEALVHLAAAIICWRNIGVIYG
ncbi:MAG: IS5 family transposase [Acidobacteriota bacterium]